MGDIEKELRFIRVELSALLSRAAIRPVALKVPEAAQAISLGQTKFRALLKSREIDSFTVDRCRLVRVAELERWAESRSVPVTIRQPKTRRKTESEKIRAALKNR